MGERLDADAGAGAATILVTVAVVNRIIERRERERKRPRELRVLYDIGLDLRLLVSTLFSDYAFTHAATYSTPPLRALDAIRHWHEGLKTVDRPEWRYEDRPLVLDGAFDFGRRLTSVRERDGDFLEPDLVAAIDDCTLGIQHARTAYSLRENPESGQVDVVAYELVGRALLAFIPVFERYDDRWTEMPDLTARAADASHSHVVREG